MQEQIFAAQINWNFPWELIFAVSFIFKAARHQQRRKLLFWVNQQSILLRQFSQWQVWHVPQRLEKYWLNLLLFCFACSKLWLLFLNANIKIKVLFTPNVWCTVSSTTSGLKGIFEYIYLMGLNFFGCKFCWCVFFFWNLLSHIKYHLQNVQKLRPAQKFQMYITYHTKWDSMEIWNNLQK